MELRKETDKMKKRIFIIAGVFWAVFLFAACGAETLLLDENGEPVCESLNESDIVVTDGEMMAEGIQAAETPTLFIHVCGAVEMPGVYELPIGSRIYDAVLAAGDFDAEADREAVNLVQELTDGEQIRIPFIGEGSDAGRNGLIDINTAGEEELCQIPGIGESRAGAIIAYREEFGRFESVEELMKVPGIKEGIYARVSTYIECR